MSMAATTKHWTLEELHSLPDDGNKYELVHGELFVTPAPAPRHESVLQRLTHTLEPYVTTHGLGDIYHPRSVVRVKGSEVEPDLMVRTHPSNDDVPWEEWPVPILVVEVISDSTRRRDQEQKRDFYINDARIPEYWIVDPERRTITSVRAGAEDHIASETMTWAPAGATEPLTFAVSDIFG